MTVLMTRFASGVSSGGSTSASCSVARTAIDAPTSPDGLAPRLGTWAKAGSAAPMNTPPRRRHTGKEPSLLSDRCLERQEKRPMDWTDIVRDYTEGWKGVLAF